MKRQPQLTLIGALVLFASLVVGCSKDTSVNSTQPDQLNLTSAFGGYTATDESPAFGDARMGQMMGEDESVTDPMMPQHVMDSLGGLAGARIFTLSIRWGMLQHDSTNTVVTDWSGSATVKRGVIEVRRLIRFERGEDHLVRPRPNRQTVEWVSHTSKDYDGILLTIIDPPGSDSILPPNDFTFTTGPYTHTFSMDDLASLDLLVNVDAIGNRIAFNGHELKLEPCGGGPLDGVWVLNPSNKNGHFFGKWVTDSGSVSGHLRGHFGARPDGKKVFFGKFIGEDGRFKGLLRGEWGFTGDSLADSTSGWFDGIWADRRGLSVGRVQGRWQSSVGDSVDVTGEGEDEGHGHGQGEHGRDKDHAFDKVKWDRGFFSGWWERECVRRDSSGSGA